MNKIKKVVGASVAGVMALIPVGATYAQMTGANIEDFYTMPLIVSRISYDDNYFGLVLRKKAVYLNIATVDPGYAEEYANARYENIGQKSDRWWRTLYNGDLSGFVVNEEKILTSESGFSFREDGLGLIYYSMGFEDGSHFEGKISYRSCKEAFDNGEYDGENYECRVHYEEGQMELMVGDQGEGFMSNYTAEKYDGSGKIATWYTYDPELKTALMAGLPGNVKTAEQVKLEETVQYLIEQQTRNLAEIDRLRNELNEKEAASVVETNNLRAKISDLEAENNRLESEINNLKTKNDRLEFEIGSLETKISNLESGMGDLRSENSQLESEISDLMSEIADLNTECDNLEAEVKEYETALVAETEKWQNELAKKEVEWQTQLAEKETEWQAQLTEKEAEWRVQLAEEEAKWQMQIEQEKTESTEKEAELTAKIEGLRTEVEEKLALKAEKLTSLETKLAELETKLTMRPTTVVKTVYVDKEVAVEKDKEAMTVGNEELENNDGTELDSKQEFEEVTPELDKGTGGPWWVLVSMGVAAGGLICWWLSSNVKLKRKK